MNQENKDTSPYVQMPRIDISPETEWYLKNTSYLQLVEENETAIKLLKEAKEAIDYGDIIEKIDQFLNKRK